MIETEVKFVSPNRNALDQRVSLFVKPTARGTDERWPVIKTGKGTYKALHDTPDAPGDLLGPIEMAEAITRLRSLYNPGSVEYIVR